MKKIHPAAWAAIIFGGVLILILIAMQVAPDAINLKDATLQD